ncbi:SDR family NAD(P)-dependent oxidoreductase [Nocardia sp. NPDC050175]|uniref:SDR family NAD(P)-dependent oxidoreductase n=1 Tax=Nocardia sp. NPDC050175 TaxID=3364317 RepID=UPI00378BB32D
MSAHRGNVGSAEDCRRTIAEVIEAHGRLDILVNNAGITTDKEAAAAVSDRGIVDWVSTLPFATDNDFRVWRYGVGHSELLLRSLGFGGFECRDEICFEGVERMELDSRFTGGLTITPVSSHGDLDDGAAMPLLLLELVGGAFGAGFVACSKVTARRFQREGDGVGCGSVLFSENAGDSVHGVGGLPPGPGAPAFGLPVLRRFAPEKRTTARFPPPRTGGGHGQVAGDDDEARG